MKTLDNLVDDIYALFGSGKEPLPIDVEALSGVMSVHIANSFKKREPKGFLRGSLVGTGCDRKLYFTVNSPDDAEDVSPWTKNKFLYGHLLEELVLFYAEEAKHEVLYRQEEVDLFGVKGHLDAVIDGVLVDVKSANSRGMNKFYNNGLLNDDPFGYLKQIQFYHRAITRDNPSVSKEEYAFLAIDKELGHIVLDRYKADYNPDEMDRYIQNKIAMVGRDVVPDRGYFAEPDGKSGNMQLGTQCKYCDYKKKCWPGLRMFKYANGPRWLTKVVKVPDVPEG